MKIFMLTLEGKAREWYESLRPGCLFSLKDIHKAFYEHYKQNSPSLSLAENCCDQFQDIIQYLLDSDEDLENLHPEDLLTSIHEFNSQGNYHDSLDELVEEEINQGIEEKDRKSVV